MKNKVISKIISVAMAVIMVSSMVVSPLSAYATEEQTQETQQTTQTDTTTPESTATPTPEPTLTPAPTPVVCSYCGGEHELTDCKVKCSVHGIEHNDVNCWRHLSCTLCGETGHEIKECPQQCSQHATDHKDKDCPRHSQTCALCNGTGHAIDNCPQQCSVHGTAHKEINCPNKVAPTDKVYISNYQIVDANGNPLSKVNPGDKVIVAVSVVDERIKASEFGVPAGAATQRIHVNMTQGAFTIPTSSIIDVKMREPVSVTNGQGYGYEAICYTISFRDVTYQGGKPDFSFGISYTGQNGTNNNNNMPLPVPHTTQQLTITQATDDIPAPTIILNQANYGKVAIIGEPFSLVTTATNTSENLDLENVSLKIVLPQGITMAEGNSQVLIGKAGKGGTINHTFNLKAEGVANDITSLPVQLIYSFEAFVGGQRTQFTSQPDISINVQQPTRFEIQNMYNDMQMYMNNESYMSASLVNKGKTTVYNVTAELVSDVLTAYDVEFLGNIMPGSTSHAEFDFTASQVGPTTGKLLVTYEDASGTQYTMEKEFTIEVLEEMVWNEPVYTEPMVVPEEPGLPIMPIVLGVVAVAAIGGFVFYKKKKKAKRLAELEDEDEDI